MVYCDILFVDCAAERFNVSWERTSPMVMSVRDDNARTIMSGESSFYFGRTAYGDLDAVKAFYFACSASFSPIEQYVGTALFPRISDNSSVTTGLGFILDNGGTIEIIQDGYCLFACIPYWDCCWPRFNRLWVVFHLLC